jgi:hypothetical protein
MSSPRRRIFRLPTSPPKPPATNRLRARLVKKRAALARWQIRLRRAFNAVAKHQKAAVRMERQLVRLEGPECHASSK